MIRDLISRAPRKQIPESGRLTKMEGLNKHVGRIRMAPLFESDRRGLSNVQHRLCSFRIPVRNK
jgi:hypothetical protein